MVKKIKLELTKSESLCGIDLELEQAMAGLDVANGRISTVLAGFNQQAGQATDYAEIDEESHDVSEDTDSAQAGGE